MVLNIIFSVIKNTLGAIWKFTKWFYTVFLPNIIQWVGIPLFILGLIAAVAFIGGWLLFLLIFIIFLYFFIKGTIFSRDVERM